MRLSTRAIKLATVGGALTLGIVGCGSSSSGSGGPTTSETPAAASSTESPTAAAAAAGTPGSLKSELPSDIQSSGVINVGTSTEFPPYDFNKAGSSTLIGFEPDLEAALGSLLGVKFVPHIVGFDALVPGVQAKRFQIAIDGVTDEKSREKVADFVDYGQAGIVILVPAGKQSTVTGGLTSLCGHSIGYATGTYGQQTTEDVAKICKQKGLAATKGVAFPNAPDIQIAQESGRIDFHLEDTATGGYDAKTSGGKIVSVVLPNAQATGDFASGKFGVVIPKGQPQLDKALQDAFNELIQNGTYTKILTKWGVSQLAVSTSTFDTPSY
jgi:polar amino acid transport system substrate-binding protein